MLYSKISNYLPTCNIKILFYRMLSFIGVAVPEIRTYFNHQRYYLNKVVRDIWCEEQVNLIAEAKQSKNALTLAGDGRCDSMGHR